MSLINNLLTWTTATFSPLGVTGLFILAFIESVFFPVPPDLLLIILSLNNPENALFFAMVATIGSVLGGIVGYYVGYLGGKHILFKLVSRRKFRKVRYYFNKYGTFAIFISALTPIPYKVFTLSAGLLYIDFKKFVLASFFGRGLRFFLVSFLIMLYGEGIVSFIDSYLEIIAVIIITVFVIFYVFYLRKKKSL